MQINRLFTQPGKDPLSSIKFVKRTSEIKNPDGSLVFKMDDVVVPEQWSQVAIDIIAQKYFRKAGVPKLLTKVPEEGIPEWLLPSKADDEKLEQLPEEDRLQRKKTAGRFFIVWQETGLIGAGKQIISIRKKMPALSMKN